jgi:hypothetical protein
MVPRPTRFQQDHTVEFGLVVLNSDRLLKLCVEVEGISPERDSENNAVEEELPGVLPQEIVEQLPRTVNALIRKHRSRLLTTHTQEEIGRIEDEFLQLKRMYRRDAVVTEAIDGIQGDGKVWEFEKCWECIATRVPLLYEFFGGLATIFPGTATVEADFSDLKWTKNEFSTSMSDFSLEAKLHARQYNKLIQSL